MRKIWKQIYDNIQFSTWCTSVKKDHWNYHQPGTEWTRSVWVPPKNFPCFYASLFSLYCNGGGGRKISQCGNIKQKWTSLQELHYYQANFNSTVPSVITKRRLLFEKTLIKSICTTWIFFQRLHIGTLLWWEQVTNNSQIIKKKTTIFLT